MLGCRGASRYYSPCYCNGFALECRAIPRLREETGLSNVVMMVPFCRSTEEADRVLDEQDEAVKWTIRAVIEAAHRSGAKVGLCGQAHSDNPTFDEYLVACGIDSMSVSPDSFIAVKRRVSAAEAERRDVQAASTQEPPS